jgi:tetratricopeptide (TPR) repeat protein
VATLLPVLGIVQVGDQSMADRYMYLPSIGPFLVIGLTAAWGWEKVTILKKQRFISQLVYAGAAIFALILISYLTCRQIEIWDNSFTLWNYVIEKEPEAVPAAYNNRGIAFGRTGQLDRAIQDFDRAIALDPSFDRAYNNRGAAYLMHGSFDKAIEDFDKAVTLRAGNASAYSNRGYAYYFEGQYDRAMKDYNKAIELDQNYAKAYLNRGNLYLGTGNKELALSDFQKACELGDRGGCRVLHGLPGENQAK